MEILNIPINVLRTYPQCISQEPVMCLVELVRLGNINGEVDPLKQRMQQESVSGQDNLLTFLD